MALPEISRPNVHNLVTKARQLAAKGKQSVSHLVAKSKQSVDELAVKTKQDEQQLTAAVKPALAAIHNPTVDGMTIQNGNRYQYDETSEEWKNACLPLPCFTAVQFPGYATAVIPGTINGVAAIVQLWKGRCERFCGTRLNFPGGVGAEVGIYIKYQPGDKMWWPAPYVIPGFNTSISWRLINPSTRTVFLAGTMQ